MYWFVALPDCPAGRLVVEALEGEHTVLAAHASGRPWLVGRVPSDQVRVVTAGNARLAVLGHAPGAAAARSGASPPLRADGGVWEESLARRLADVRVTDDLSDADQLAALLRGSCHWAVSAQSAYRLQGSASGLRRVYRARWRGLTVAADRADVLAALTGASLDERHLALTLLADGPPAPADEVCPWAGVEAVPAGSALTVSSQGAACVRRWWRPPAPELPLPEGTTALREELRAAVAERVRGESAAGRTPGCDLSGGMDSTSLAFLARDLGVAPVTLTVAYRDDANDDPYWADLAQRQLLSPGTSVLRLAGDLVPRQYAGLDTVPAPTDAVSPMLRGRAVLEAAAAAYARNGVALHLAGHGGDEVVQACPGYLHGLARRHPRLALRHLRGHRARRRWPLGPTLRALADHRSYSQWLAGEAGRLSSPERAGVPFGWGEPLDIAPWATREARALVAEVLRDAARTAEPLAPDRGQHATLQRVRTAAQIYRLMRQELAAPWIALPFFDDRVLEACLAIRLEERGTPYAYKHPLATAVRGTVPDTLLTRATKGSADTDFYEGLREQRKQLRDLVDHSVLAERGLIDPAAFRNALLAPVPRTAAHLEDTLGCEHWLRLTSASSVHTIPEERL